MLRLLPRFVAVAVMAVLVSSCGSGTATNADTLRGAVVTPPRSVGEISLPDASDGGKPFVTRAAKGHLLLVYFGYTSCPDICPTTLADIRKALADQVMASHKGKVDLAFVTIDPVRDDGDLVTRYVQGFIPGSHALWTDSPDALAKAAEAFGTTYSVVDPGHNQPVQVGHSAITHGVDDRGFIVAQWPFGVPAVDFAHDFAMILDGEPLQAKQ